MILKGYIIVIIDLLTFFKVLNFIAASTSQTILKICMKNTPPAISQ
jgi:hypothetical protein